MKKKKTPPKQITPEQAEKAIEAFRDFHARSIEGSLEDMQAAYQAGEKIKLLEAAVWCGKCGFKLPTWITADLGAALERYSTFEVKTLDEAFGVPKRKKGIHVSTSHNFLKISFPVFMRVSVLRSEGVIIDDSLFGSVAGEFAINATLAKEYYYYWRKILPVKHKGTPAL